MLGDFEICNSPKHLFDQDYCIGSCTGKTSYFCIDEQDEKHYKEPVNIPETLIELDEDNMMTQCPERYITMTADDIGVSLPSGLMDCRHHNNDMPRALHRTRSVIKDIEASGA